MTKNKVNNKEEKTSLVETNKDYKNSPEFRKMVDYYKKKYAFTSKTKIVVFAVLGSLLIGGGVGTSIYFGLRNNNGQGEAYPDQRIPTLVDTAEKFEIKDITRTNSGITFKVSPKDGTTHCDKVIIKIGGTTLNNTEFTFKDSIVSIPSSTLAKYTGHINVEPKFDDKTAIYFKYSTIHIDATDDTSFTIPYEVTDSGKIEWKSDNENFIEIDKDTGIATLQTEAVEGTTVELKVKITATAVDSTSEHKTAECVISIIPTTQETLAFVATKGENFDGYSVKAKAGTTLSGEIVVPGCYEGKPVISVSALGFYNQTGITKITLPESVTSIGTQAFNGCSGLTSINLPKAMFSLGTAVFKSTNTNLAIDFENKTTKWSTYLGTAKQGEVDPTTKSPTDIATEIKNLADNINLVRNGVEDPDSNLQYYITSEITCSVAPKNSDIEGEVNIPAIVEYNYKPYKVNAILYDSINKASCFKGCTKITKINIPSTIEYITKGSFATCKKLTHIDVDGNNPYFTSSKGILYTKGFESLLCYPAAYSGEGITTKFVLPKPTKIIEENSFANSNIEEFSYSEESNLKTINFSSFSYCTSLKKVQIPASTTFVDWKVFTNCTAIQTIEFENPNGWSYYSGGTPDLSNPEDNAKNFTDTSHPCWADGIMK